MRVPFDLTRTPTTVTATGRQSLDQVIDVSEFDTLDLLLIVQNYSNTSGNYGAAVVVLTSSRNDGEQGWVTLCSFPPVLVSNGAAPRSVTRGILRYIRWSVPVLGGIITFSISGQGNLWTGSGRFPDAGAY
jgi:hypothetical protein